MTTISPSDVSARMGRGEKLTLVDVRTPMEFAQVHAVGAVNVPLDRLDPQALMRDRDNGESICFICKSGMRAGKACDALVSAGFDKVINVQGGTDAWVAAGLPVERRDVKVISLERQVRIAAGLIITVGAVLALTMNIWFALICAFCGMGLVFAGVTDSCAMGLILARAPWNRGADVGTCSRI